jgi:hypothetical protein
MSEPTKTDLTKEERAFMLKTVWEALQSAPWTKDSIIEFGKAIFSKLPLKSLDEKKFEIVFPNLLRVSDDLGTKIKIEWQLKIMQEIMSTIASSEPPAPAPAPANTVSGTEATCIPDASYKPPFIATPTLAKVAPPVPQPLLPTQPPLPVQPALPVQPPLPTQPAPPTPTAQSKEDSDGR